MPRYYHYTVDEHRFKEHQGPDDYRVVGAYSIGCCGYVVLEKEVPDPVPSNVCPICNGIKNNDVQMICYPCLKVCAAGDGFRLETAE